ncbi:MAG: cytochrome c oxidase assembly protein [Hyphomicrobiales bacterium]|nr:cytochrome c oxidase assembly protein [Hyphomicrobiales bacterium]
MRAMTLLDAALRICSSQGADTPGWSFDPWVLGPLALSATLYVLGTMRLWRRAGLWRGISFWQALAYAAGWLVLATALLSPLHWSLEHLFALHMAEHELLMAVAAPLIALSCPVGAFLWALPKKVRTDFSRVLRSGVLRAVWKFITRPHVATILHGVAIWVWHLPGAFDAALFDVALHRLQHLSFFATALIFWWSLIRRSNPGAAAGHLFITIVHTSVLGALLALAPRVLYPLQASFATAWGLTPLEDQELAGLIMWVPAGTIYAGAALGLLGLWVARCGRLLGPGHALARA